MKDDGYKIEMNSECITSHLRYREIPIAYNEDIAISIV